MSMMTVARLVRLQVGCGTRKPNRLHAGCLGRPSLHFGFLWDTTCRCVGEMPVQSMWLAAVGSEERLGNAQQ